MGSTEIESAVRSHSWGATDFAKKPDVVAQPLSLLHLSASDVISAPLPRLIQRIFKQGDRLQRHTQPMVRVGLAECGIQSFVKHFVSDVIARRVRLPPDS